VRGSNIVNLGIDLTEFYLSVEWDILGVPATRNEEYYIPQSKALILEERAALEAAGDEVSNLKTTLFYPTCVKSDMEIFWCIYCRPLLSNWKRKKINIKTTRANC
jgi:hypothetical protein